MKTTCKELYESPSAFLVEVKLEGIVCQSKKKPDSDPKYDSWDDEDW